MKLLLLILLSNLGMTVLQAQVSYSLGNTVKGKNVSYYCPKESTLTVTVRNTKNIDTLQTMYFENGEIVPDDWQLSGQLGFEQKELVQTLKNALTMEEWELWKSKKVLFQILVVADKTGNTLEIEFMFLKTDPVFSKIDPDRLFLLETNLKKLLKLQVGEGDRGIKHLKYIVPINYRDVKNA